MARPKPDTQAAQAAPVKSIEQLAIDVQVAMTAHRDALIAHLDNYTLTLQNERDRAQKAIDHFAVWQGD